MWLEQDQNGFRDAVKNGIGQIRKDSVLGKQCRTYAAKETYKTYVEVGTWNGLGTTKVMYDEMKRRKDHESGGYEFYSLECNTDKSDIASMYYRGEKNVHILTVYYRVPH